MSRLFGTCRAHHPYCFIKPQVNDLLQNGPVAKAPKVYSLRTAAVHDRAVLCLTGIFPSITPNFVQSTNSSDRSNVSALCSSELLSRYSASSILHTALTTARNLSSSDISVCQEKYIVAHGLKGRHAVSVTQAIPCSSVRGLSLTFNGHLSPAVRRRQK